MTEHEGKAIVRLAKHKVHVCWYGGDGALLGRRPLNWGRAAIGRNGLYEYSKEEDLIKHEGKLVDKEAKDEKDKPWNAKVPLPNYLLGHNYQTTDPALEYYLTSMKEHCDNKC